MTERELIKECDKKKCEKIYIEAAPKKGFYFPAVFLEKECEILISRSRDKIKMMNT